MRGRVIAAFPCIVLFLLAACSQPTGEQVSKTPSEAEASFMISKEVRDADAARKSAIENGDIEAYLAFFLEDAVWIPPHSPEVIGREMARLRAGELLKQISIQQTIETQEQTVMAPDWVVDRGRYTMKIMPKSGGEARYESGPFLNIWRRDADGKWKIAFDMWGSKSPLVETAPITR